MEDLNKHQLILLTLLISFVTSIATGIITFTLLSEAPVEVTQQINHVVEKTIEQVAPTTPGQPEKVTTTVVVNEEDRILEAIAKNEKSIVRLRNQGLDGSTAISGLGLVISSDGAIVSSIKNYTPGANYSLIFSDGKEYPTKKIFEDNANGLVFMEAAVPKSEKYTFYPVAFGNSDGLKIGQSIIGISGRENNAASIGRIKQLNTSEDKKTITGIISDIPVSTAYPGSPLLNLSGEIVGMQLLPTEGQSTFYYTPISTVRSASTKALEELSK